MKRSLLFVLAAFVGATAFAQITQTVRGKIIDSETRYPLIGATVALMVNGEVGSGTVTDAGGNFRIENVPVGRQNFKVQFVGYKEKILNNIVVTSAKEVILNIELDESNQRLDEVTISVTRDGEVSNELALVSAREFSVDETMRYAGSRGDPARTASNFAGVQGADDSRNDIVIRGNSPQSVIWQLEGVIMPNPNHFAIPGTNGGPVSIVNFKTLRNSDFYTGAFPAEFGNSTAGVFDLKLRNGNNQNHEFSGMFGLMGTEAFAEGPLNKEKGSSYLINYRYSTISMFLALGIDVGTNSAPTYQDATFRFTFPQKNGAELAFWGLGGRSYTEILISPQIEPVQELYGDSDRDQYFGSDVGILGATYSYPIDKNTFWKTTVAASNQTVNANHDRIVSRDTLENGNFDPESVVLTPLLDYTFSETKYTVSSSLFKKLGIGRVLKFGFMADMYDMRYVDSIRIENDGEWPASNNWNTRWDTDGRASLFNYYIQYKHHLRDNLIANAGLHGTYFSLSNSFSAFEPRLGLRWNLPRRQSLSFGTGLHSQIQALYLYYYTDPNLVATEGMEYNRNMDLSKSAHVVIGYNNIMAKNLRLKVEAYAQTLFNVPVEASGPSSFSLVNTGSGFSRFFPGKLENTGTGFNYGLEFTLERFFDNNFFYMITASFYDSKYQGSDGVIRNTDFNGNYMFNALGTKEFKVSKNAIVGIGPKVTYAGGRRYGNPDVEASTEAQEIIWEDEGYNEQRFPDYFRTDLRITYVVNRPKVSHELAFDLVNIFNTRNILNIAWAPGINPEGIPGITTNPNFALSYQIGFLPVFYYKFDF
ncbi:MAG: TonB-dependent receptor [Bacteroidia bacterium]